MGCVFQRAQLNRQSWPLEDSVLRGADALNRSKQAAERLLPAQILDLWSIAHRSPRLARLFLALPSCAIAGFANSLVTSALWVRDGPVVRIETSITNFDPQVPPGCIRHIQCACACAGGDKDGRSLDACP